MSVSINGTSGITFNNASTQDVGGVGTGSQAWSVVTGSRVLGTTYTNSTGKPIMVFVYTSGGGGSGSLTVTINGTSTLSAYYSSYALAGISFIVTNGSTYSASGGTLSQWSELR